jgi:hypothetical protein
MQINNEPVAWMYKDEENAMVSFRRDTLPFDAVPLYTHPAKELHLSLQKSKETGELLAVTYTDDEHRIVEVLWQKPPAKTLTDEKIEVYKEALEKLARLGNGDEYGNSIGNDIAIDALRKAQGK